MDVIGELHAPFCFTPGKNPDMYLTGGCVGPQKWEKSVAPDRI